jgi:hypothetical protein
VTVDGIVEQVRDGPVRRHHGDDVTGRLDN